MPATTMCSCHVLIPLFLARPSKRDRESCQEAVVPPRVNTTRRAGAPQHIIYFLFQEGALRGVPTQGRKEGGKSRSRCFFGFWLFSFARREHEQHVLGVVAPHTGRERSSSRAGGQPAASRAMHPHTSIRTCGACPRGFVRIRKCMYIFSRDRHISGMSPEIFPIT